MEHWKLGTGQLNESRELKRGKRKKKGRKDGKTIAFGKSGFS